MKRLLVLLSCALFLCIAAPVASAAPDIRLWPHKHHKEASETTEAPKPKTKKSLLHRAKPSREDSAHSEATYGMTGPKSVGWLHHQPGPAGYGAK